MTKRTLSCALFVLISGCTTTVAVPVVKEAQSCAPDKSLLAACAEPEGIEPGITFGAIIEVLGRDRESLRQCALRQRSLAEAIAACNSAIERYNADIREFNARHAKQP